MLCRLLVSTALQAVLALCLSSNQSANPLSHDVALVDLVPAVTTLENLAVRQNGDILVTSIASPYLHQINPSASYAPLIIAGFPAYSGLLGITELEKDVFYVATTKAAGEQCANAVHKIDLRNFTVTSSGSIIDFARTSLVRELCTVGILNGMSRLSSTDTTNLMISDSIKGVIYRLNVKTGAYNVALDTPEFKPLATGINVGVNGIYVHGNLLYFTSLDQGLFARVPISLQTGTSAGKVEILARNITFGDDFALSSDGTRAWVATNGPEEIIEVQIANKTQSVLAKSPFLGSASSVALGSLQSRTVLFVTGGLSVGVSQNNTRASLAMVELD